MQYGNGESTALLCDVDEALVPSAYQDLFDPDVFLHDTVAFFPRSPRFVVMALAWLFFAPLCVVGIYLSTAYLERGGAGTLAAQFVCTVLLLGASCKAAKSGKAMLDLRAGKWRHGIFVTESTLILRMEPSRCYVLPREAISSVHIFHKVDMMEHVVASGTHTHIRVVYHDSNGEREWVDVEASSLEASVRKVLRLLQEWHQAGTSIPNKGDGDINVCVLEDNPTSCALLEDAEL